VRGSRGGLKSLSRHCEGTVAECLKAAEVFGPQLWGSWVSQPLQTEGIDPEIGARLNELLMQSGLKQLDSATVARFESYFALYQRWNARTNLSAIRDREGILSRHFVESIACARNLPEGIGTLLDVGSGAGFPGIPIALCRPEILVTLAESQGKKAAFLREAVRILELGTTVHGGRAETLNSRFDCVILRAVDRMSDAVRVSAGLVNPGGWLAEITTIDEMDSATLSLLGFSFDARIPLPASERRVLALGRRFG
jgi:16S rRNA (guanine527-N7)-methyltransferase